MSVINPDLVSDNVVNGNKFLAAFLKLSRQHEKILLGWDPAEDITKVDILKIETNISPVTVAPISPIVRVPSTTEEERPVSANRKKLPPVDSNNKPPASPLKLITEYKTRDVTPNSRSMLCRVEKGPQGTSFSYSSKKKH
jgi:hypothetical protein